MGRFGWHSGKLTCEEVEVNGDFSFGDASTDTLTVNGTLKIESDNEIQLRDSGITINSPADGKMKLSADGGGSDDIQLSGGVTIDSAVTLSGADSANTIEWTGTNTSTTPAFKLPDDTYVADADGSIGSAAEFIVVDIDGTNYKLQTYSMS